MCGIFGIYMTEASAATEDWTPTEFAQLAFPAIRHRGPHAFGWMSYDGVSVEVHKFDGDVGRMENLSEVEISNHARWIVGHVRYATHGNTSNLNNNHPIEHGDIVGVHNGVLRNHDEILDVTGREHDDTEVDSEAIFAAVDKWGHRAGLRRIEGDMVTVYTRFSKPENLWFGKSHSRPLVFARTRAGSLVWASELKVLRSVFGADLTDVREIKTNQLVRVSGALVKEICQFAPAPPEPTPPKRRIETRITTRDGNVRTFNQHRGDKRGEILFGRKPEADTAAEQQRAPQDAGQRLSKAQRKRARRNEAARRALAQASYGESGWRWFRDMLVTEEEYDMLMAEQD